MIPVSRGDSGQVSAPELADAVKGGWGNGQTVRPLKDMKEASRKLFGRPVLPLPRFAPMSAPGG
eukprot:3654558-Amphidinium_carterae.1